MPNSGQPVTEAAVRGRGSGACKNRTCGSMNPQMLHGRSRQEVIKRCHLQDPMRCHYLRQGSPLPGGKVKFRVQADEKDGRKGKSGRKSRDAGGVLYFDHPRCPGTDVEVAQQGRGTDIDR